ncbi:MAG: VIT1/CCC1 transporter family protein [Candidatus Hodarchaeales archaeon]
MGQKLDNLHELYNISNAAAITRRYLVIGAFDGVLTALGIILGAVISGEATTSIIVSGTIGGMLALAISSAWGAYEIEKIEQSRVTIERNKCLLEEFSHTVHDRASSFLVRWGAFVHGVSPLVAGLLMVIPFLFLKLDLAVDISVMMGIFNLFFLV